MGSHCINTTSLLSVGTSYSHQTDFIFLEDSNVGREAMLQESLILSSSLFPKKEKFILLLLTLCCFCLKLASPGPVREQVVSG